METPEQLMPPPSTDGAASMINGHADDLATQYTASGQLQKQNDIEAVAQNEAQAISAGILLVYAGMQSVD